MKTKLIKSLMLLGALSVGSLPVAAESFSMMVPFDFHVGDKILPAGSYSIESSGSMLLLRGAATSMFINSVPANLLLAAPASANAVFAKSAAGPTLESVKFASGLMQSLIPSERASSLSVALARP